MQGEGLGQIQQQELRQTLSVQQLQYVKLLAMNAIELNGYLNHLHTENPVVDLTAPTPSLSGSDDTLEVAAWLSRSSARVTPAEHGDSEGEGREDSVNHDRYEDDRYNLQAYLRNQFDVSLTDFDLTLMEWLICSLDRSGYLTITPEVLQQQGFDPALAAEAIEYLQTLEPAGIGAKNLAQCLLIQLESQGLATPLAQQLLEKHLDDLAHGHFQKAARQLNCDVTQVKELYAVIRTLNPRPAASFGNEAAGYILPDVTVTEDKQGLRVRYNKGYHPQISINEGYLRMANEDDTAKQYISRKLSQAMWVMKAVQSRQDTIERIVAYLLERQQLFFTGTGAIVPLRLRDVAEKLQIHESTVSRAVSEKYLECKRGIFPLKYFFSGSVVPSSGEGDEQHSSRAVKDRIAQMIAQESSASPLSDSAIAVKLNKEGFTAARRTIAKYREELGISPSGVRRK